MMRTIIMKLEDDRGRVWFGTVKVEEPDNSETLEEWRDFTWWFQSPFGEEFEEIYDPYYWEFKSDGTMEITYYEDEYYGAPEKTLRGEWRVVPQEEALNLPTWEEIWEASLPPKVFWKFWKREQIR